MTDPLDPTDPQPEGEPTFPLEPEVPVSSEPVGTEPVGAAPGGEGPDAGQHPYPGYSDSPGYAGYSASAGYPGYADYSGYSGYHGYGYGTHGYGYGYGASATPKRPAPAAWMWPVVIVVTLVVGLIGGSLGGAIVLGVHEAAAPTTSTGIPQSQAAAPLSGVTDVTQVAAKLLPSTVQVIADIPGPGIDTGSGFVLDGDGHVITNNHVVADAADGGTITVVDYRGRTHDATIVGRSQVYDVAVLKVSGISSLPAVAIGSSKDLQVGEPVVAIGSPLGLSSTVTSGIVSALGRPVSAGPAKTASFFSAVQTDAAINPGNSGGPLVNMQGQVIGVNSAIATVSQDASQAGNIGVGFAIPIEQVQRTADQILATGEARYPVIGANVQTGSKGNGAYVSAVPSGSPADQAGIQAGDVIVAVNGVTVHDGVELIVLIRDHRPGDTVTLSVRHDGTVRQVDVVLGSEVG